jgi:hypothetical protein
MPVAAALAAVAMSVFAPAEWAIVDDQQPPGAARGDGCKKACSCNDGNSSSWLATSRRAQLVLLRCERAGIVL